MTLAITLVSLIALVLGYRVLMFALRHKRDLRAGASVGKSTFYVEVGDRERGT